MGTAAAANAREYTPKYGESRNRIRDAMEVSPSAPAPTMAGSATARPATAGGSWARAVSMFASSTQGRIVVAISLASLVAAFVCGASAPQLAVRAMKMALMAYTTNCLVVGNCVAYGWFSVVMLAMSFADDLYTVIKPPTAPGAILTLVSVPAKGRR